MKTDAGMYDRLVADMDRMGPEKFFMCLKQFIQNYSGLSHPDRMVELLMGLATYLDELEREFET